LTALNTAARARLVKSLALLSSPVDGEKLAAASAACRIIAAAGLTWADLIRSAEVRREPLHTTWRATCAELAKRPGDLRAWERKFVIDLPNFPRISTKQRYILNEIADRVLGGSRH
jgi:hypothetical protein